MNCSDVQALIGPMVDGVVEPGEKKAFHGHLSECDICKRSFELEVVAKSLVQTSVPHVPTPMDVRRSVLATLHIEAERSSRSWVSRVFGSVPAPAYALAAAAVLVLYLFMPGEETSLDEMIRHAGERDVMTQAASNFSLIQSGEIKPSLTSCSPENVYAYLEAQQLPFTGRVRPLERCDGYSVFVNEYEGVKVAHVVYTIGDDLLYVYQVNINESLTDTGHLTMPLAAKNAIRTTGWYSDPDHPECNTVVWEEDGTLCAATSTMDKTRMLALLATR